MFCLKLLLRHANFHFQADRNLCHRHFIPRLDLPVHPLGSKQLSVLPGADLQEEMVAKSSLHQQLFPERRSCIGKLWLDNCAAKGCPLFMISSCVISVLAPPGIWLWTRKCTGCLP